MPLPLRTGKECNKIAWSPHLAICIQQVRCTSKGLNQDMGGRKSGMEAFGSGQGGDLEAVGTDGVGSKDPRAQIRPGQRARIGWCLPRA